MDLASIYRDRVRASGGRWTDSAGLWASAAGRVIGGTGYVTVQSLREARGSGSYSTAIKQLERMTEAGVLVANKRGHRTKSWRLPEDTAQLGAGESNAGQGDHSIGPAAASRTRPARGLSVVARDTGKRGFVDVRLYRAALEADGRRWTHKRSLYAEAVARAVTKRGLATTAHVRELAGEGAKYADAWAVLDEMDKAGVIECVADGRRKAWYAAGQVPQAVASSQRNQARQVADDHVPVLDLMRRGSTDDLVRARGQLHLGRYHLDQARRSIDRAVSQLRSSGATAYDLVLLGVMVDAIDEGQRSLAIIAGADPALPPLDLRELGEQCDAVRDRDHKSTIPRDSLPYGDLANRAPVAIKEVW